jgi:hypothetical protein
MEQAEAEVYWSLRLVRDLARALFADEVADEEVDAFLAAYEVAVAASFRHDLSRGRLT